VSFSSNLSNTVVGIGTIDVTPSQCIMGSLCVPGSGLNDILLTVDSLSYTLADANPLSEGLILGQPLLLLYIAPQLGSPQLVVNPSPPPFNTWFLNTPSKRDNGTYAVTPTAVPEPAAGILLLVPLAMLGLSLRRKAHAGPACPRVGLLREGRLLQRRSARRLRSLELRPD
jgi:hypothetical protein